MTRVLVTLAALCISLTLLAGCSASTESKNAGPTSVASNLPPSGFRVSQEGVDASEPAIATLTDGRVVVAYVVKEGEAGDLNVHIVDPASSALSEPVRVNPVAGQVKTWYGDPPTVAVGSNGNLFVGWTAKYPQGAQGTILYMSVSQDGGRTFEEPVRVNDDTAPASHGMHSMAIAPDGRVHFAWLDERYLKVQSALPSMPMQHLGHATPHPKEADVEPNAELYYAVSTNGKSFSANRRLASDVCPCCKTSTAVSSTGDLAIGYRKVFNGEYRHIAVNTLKDGSDGFSQPVQVSDDGWKINACPVSGPALRFDRDDLVVAWFSGGDAGPQGIYVSRSTDLGRTFAQRTLVEETHAGGLSNWAGDRLFWSGEGEIRSADLARSGTFEVNSAGAGKNAVAAQVGNRSFFAYVRTEGDTKSVWLGETTNK